MKIEGREPEELVVQPNHARAEPGAGHDAGQRARSGDHERPLDVVPGQLTIRVSERFERSDLRALQRQRARQRDVQDKGRDAEEDGWRDEAEGLELSELVVEHPGGCLDGPRDRAEAAVGFEQPVEPGDDVGGIGPSRGRDGHVVETALHVECGCEGAAAHPEDPELPLIREDRARTDGVDVLRRQRDPDDRQPPAPSVDDRGDAVAGIEAVGFAKDLAREHFVGTGGIDPSSPAQEHVVQQTDARGRVPRSVARWPAPPSPERRA